MCFTSINVRQNQKELLITEGYLTGRYNNASKGHNQPTKKATHVYFIIIYAHGRRLCSLLVLTWKYNQ